MSSKDLASACGVSQRQIYNLKTKFPKEVPASFADVAGWKKVVAAHQVIVAQKRHAPRSHPGEHSDNARYIAARARRTEALAEARTIPKIEQQVADLAVCLRNQSIDKELAELRQALGHPDLSPEDNARIVHEMTALRSAKRAPLISKG